MMKDKKILKGLIVLVCLFVLSLFVELVIFNFHAWYDFDIEMHGEDAKIEFDKDYIIYDWNVNGHYISMFEMSYTSGKDFVYEVEYNEDAKEELNVIEDKGYYDLDYSATIIDKTIDSIKVFIPRDSECEIYDIVISNKKSLNYSRIFAILSILIVLTVIIDYFYKKRLSLAETFFIFSIIFGIYIILLMGPDLNSWDEQIHFKNAWNLSFLSKVEETAAVDMYEKLSYPEVNTCEERTYLSNYLEKNNVIPDIKLKSNYIHYQYIAYLPSACGFILGRLFGFSFVNLIYIGKFMNLLFYTSLISCAIKLCEKSKYIIFVIGLMPTSLFIASSFSYDAFITSMLLLGVGLIIEEIYSNNRIDSKRILLSISCVVVGVFSKAVYIPILFILVLLSTSKFYSKRQSILFKMVIIGIILLMLSTFVIPTASSVVNGTYISGDSRGGDTSTSLQLQYILNDIWKYCALLVYSVISTLKKFLLYSNAFWAYVPFEGYMEISILYAVILGLVIFTQRYVYQHEDKVSNMVNIVLLKFVMFILIIGVLALIWTALYLSFTPVGADYIQGVQARYYIPLLLPFAFLFYGNKNKKISIKENWYVKFIIIGIGIVWIGAICCSWMRIF